MSTASKMWLHHVDIRQSFAEAERRREQQKRDAAAGPVDKWLTCGCGAKVLLASGYIGHMSYEREQELGTAAGWHLELCNAPIGWHCPACKEKRHDLTNSNP